MRHLGRIVGVKSGRKRKNLTPAEYLYGLAEGVCRELMQYALALAGQMAAVDAVHTELAAEFEGEDLRQPEVTERAELIWTKLRALVHALEGPKELPGSDESLEGLRAEVERSFRFFHLLEPALTRQRPSWESVIMRGGHWLGIG